MLNIFFSFIREAQDTLLKEQEALEVELVLANYLQRKMLVSELSTSLERSLPSPGELGASFAYVVMPGSSPRQFPTSLYPALMFALSLEASPVSILSFLPTFPGSRNSPAMDKLDVAKTLHLYA